MTPERLQEIEGELRDAYERDGWKLDDAYYLRQMIEAAQAYRQTKERRRQDARGAERRAKENAPVTL